MEEARGITRHAILLPWVIRSSRVQERHSGVKRAYVDKVCYHRFDYYSIKHAPQEGGPVIQPGAWRSNVCCRYCRHEGGLVKNEGGELKVGVCDSSLEICRRD